MHYSSVWCLKPRVVIVVSLARIPIRIRSRTRARHGDLRCGISNIRRELSGSVSVARPVSCSIVGIVLRMGGIGVCVARRVSCSIVGIVGALAGAWLGA